MGSRTVKPAEPTPGKLIATCYAEPEYIDNYRIAADEGVTIEQFAVSFFDVQPAWLLRLSMNIRKHQSPLEEIGDGRFVVGSSVGTWQVHERSDDEIVFGEHMGFMEYRFSLFMRPDGAVEASTVVKYRKRFAPFYFTIVKPFHRGFMKILLANAADAALDQGVHQ